MRRLAPLLVLLVACDQVGATTKDKPGGDKPKRPPAPVAVKAATTGAISAYYVATATLEAEKTATVLARVNGVIESIAVEEGDRVKNNAVLLRIDNDEYRLKVAQSDAATARLLDQKERLEKLVAKKLGTVEEFMTVKQDYATAQAAADLDPLIARVYVPSKELKRLKQGQPVKLVLDSNRTELVGKIFLVSPIIDPTTGTVKVSIQIDEYPEGTRPGDFAEVRIVTERREDALLVPRVAVVEERSDQVVYVAKGEAAERRVVELGFEEGDNVQITKGLAEGDQVVIKGQHSLEDGAPIKVLEG